MGATIQPNVHAEPCLECGEETAVGSYFFSDRDEVELPNGTRGYLCSECANRIRTAGADAARDASSLPMSRPYGMTYLWFGRITPHEGVEGADRPV